MENIGTTHHPAVLYQLCTLECKMYLLINNWVILCTVVLQGGKEHI